jgi:hypothetical protein
MHSFQVTRWTTPKQGVPLRLCPAESPLAVQVDKVPVIPWSHAVFRENSGPMVRVQRVALSVSQFTPTAATAIHAVPLGFLLRIRQLTSAYTGAFLARRGGTFQSCIALNHACLSLSPQGLRWSNIGFSFGGSGSLCSLTSNTVAQLPQMYPLNVSPSERIRWS